MRVGFSTRMPKEADKTRDDVLRQMLKTPPKPHKLIGKRSESNEQSEKTAEKKAQVN
jgi:hypothetical protein